MTAVVLKIIDLLIIAIPALIEVFRRRRANDETPADFVRRVQDEKLKTTELLLEGKGDDLSRMAHTRLLVTRQLLRGAKRVRARQGDEPAT